jgi:FkbM family methyltransferase
MLAKANIIIDDFFGLRRVCGTSVALRWLLAVVTNVRRILRERNLKSADAALGPGPYTVRHPAKGAKPFRIVAHNALGLLREMCVRDGYLRSGVLTIDDGDVVVDLGANIGMFSILALSCGEGVRVVAVEPNAGLNAEFETSMRLNGNFRDRVTLIRGFIATRSEKMDRFIESDDNYVGATYLSEDDVIRIGQLKKIDFLKCDIEGGEFALLEDGKLLDMAKKLAMEVHASAGDVDHFIKHLQRRGFHIRQTMRAPDNGTAVLLADRQ